MNRLSLFPAIATSVLVILATHSFALAEGIEYRAVHGVDVARLEKWLKEVNDDGFRPTFASGFHSGDGVICAAIAVKDGRKIPYQVHFGLTPAGLQQTFDKLTADGFREICISGYRQKKELRYLGIWINDQTKNAWEARVELTAATYQEVFNRTSRDGMLPIFLTGYPDGADGGRIGAIFRKQEAGEWNARHELSAADYQKVVTEQARNKFRPTTLGIYPSAQGPRFAAVWVKDARPWIARHNLTADDYQREFDRQGQAGFRPECVVPYDQEGQLRYAAIWVKDIAPVEPPPLPASGREVPEFAEIERALLNFMKERSIPTGTLAIGRDGVIEYSRGFGYADEARKRVVWPDDPFRLASVVKPITAAAVRKLIADKKLTLGEKAFPFLDLDYPEHFAKDQRDKRLTDITIQHLLEHRGGWDRGQSFDPMFRTWEISEALREPAPPGAKQVIRYMLGQPLQFAPGSRSSYSNFGYCVLGRVIEKQSGKSYVDYIRRDLLAPLKITSCELARSLPQDRNPREPHYFDPGQGDNVLLAKRGKIVPSADGGFYSEAMDSHGGLICSAPDLIRFLSAYWISGHPREGKAGQEWTHFGSLPGTFTMVRQRRDGVNIAVLFNQRTDASGKSYDDILSVLDKAIDGVKTWPGK